MYTWTTIDFRTVAQKLFNRRLKVPLVYSANRRVSDEYFGVKFLIAIFKNEDTRFFRST